MAPHYAPASGDEAEDRLIAYLLLEFSPIMLSMMAENEQARGCPKTASTMHKAARLSAMGEAANDLPETGRFLRACGFTRNDAAEEMANPCALIAAAQIAGNRTMAVPNLIDD